MYPLQKTLLCCLLLSTASIATAQESATATPTTQPTATATAEPTTATTVDPAAAPVAAAAETEPTGSTVPPADVPADKKFGIHGSRTLGTNLLPNLLKAYAAKLGVSMKCLTTIPRNVSSA
jgi:hypothetical protein